MLVGASLQRPFLQRWLAQRLGAHANVRILMPGDLALLLGAPAAGRRGAAGAAAAGRPGAAGRRGPQASGLLRAGRRDSGLRRGAVPARAGASRRRLSTSPSLRTLLDGTTDAPEKAASLAEILAGFEARRTGFYGPDDALLAAEPDAPGRARAAGMGDARPAAGARAAAASVIAERMPVDVYLADVPAAADAPLAAMRARLLAGRRHAGDRAEPGRSGRLRLTGCGGSLFEPPTEPGDPGRRDAAAGVGARPLARGARGGAGVP